MPFTTTPQATRGSFKHAAGLPRRTYFKEILYEEVLAVSIRFDPDDGHCFYSSTKPGSNLNAITFRRQTGRFQA